MNKAEREALAKETADAVILGLKAEKKMFWVEPEHHYRAHLFVRNFRVLLIWSASIGGAAIIVWAVHWFLGPAGAAP